MGNMRFASGSLKSDLLLPDDMRQELRDPLGELVSGEMAVGSLRNGSRLFTVGDQCTSTFIEDDIVPDVFVVDYQIKRRPSHELKDRFDQASEDTMNVSNPAATITKELWSAIFRALRSDKKTRIEVDGEEDLATLPCISLAENGSQVAYGLPDQGIVLVDVNDESKRRVWRILERMRESNAS